MKPHALLSPTGFPRLGLLLVMLLVTACNNAYYRKGPAVAELVLKQAITIPAGEGRVFLQRGRVLAGHPDEYSPHCSLELYHLNPNDYTVDAGVYPISLIQDYETPVVMIVPLRYAANPTDDSSPEDIMLGFNLWFSSSVGDDPQRLTCLGALAAPWEANEPTVAEINQLLGGLGSLTLFQRHPNLH